MEFFLNRYRNLSVLLVAILAQLALLAYQVKSNQDVRLIRVWAMAAVTPLARVIETGRLGVSGVTHDYFYLLDVREENKRLKSSLDHTEIENQYLRAQVATADRAKALAILQATSLFPTVGARVIAYTTDTGGKTVVVDRGASSGIQKNMAVIKAEGIVGKVIDVYPNTANVLLLTDASFAAGVVSANNRVLGVLKGQGHSSVTIEYVQNEQKVEPGEWFLTSGEDLIFPPGLKVGQAAVVRDGRVTKEILLAPSGLQNGLEEVLIVTGGVQGNAVSEAPIPNQPVHLMTPPPGENNPPPSNGPAAGSTSGAAAPAGANLTDADRVTQRLRPLGPFGDQNRSAPDFNAPRPAPKPVAVSPPNP